MKRVIVSGSFDDLRSRHVRLLEEAAKLGHVHLLLWSDERVQALSGAAPKFPLAERRYFVEAIRYVDQVTLLNDPAKPDELPDLERLQPDLWVVDAAEANPQKQAFCETHRFGYYVLSADDLTTLPPIKQDYPEEGAGSGAKKVIVTGCFDWLHSGHVRFFEEVSELGDLYVAVGNDANVRALKGEGHPLFPQNLRWYMVQAIRHVTQALVTSGQGWMDAAPDIARLKPEIYAVNEDGDKPEKRAFCAEHGLEYVVLKREPRAGLPRRESTALRGF